MTTPDPSPLGDATDADMADQHRSIDDADNDVWLDAKRVSEDRDWQASEADLIEQAIAAPADESESDR